MSAEAEPIAAAILPLEVKTKGELSIASNLDAFRESVSRFVAGINLNPSTDLEFGRAQSEVKLLQSAQDAIKAEKEKALAQAESLNDFLSGLDQADAEIRAARLNLEKTIKAKTEEVKSGIIAGGIEGLDCAPRLREKVFGRSVADAIKGKRTLESMKTAVSTIVAIHNAAIAKSRAAIQSFVTAHGADLVPDAEDLEVETLDKVEGELRRRFEAKKAREEAARLRAEKEAAEKEAAKARAEAQAAAQAAKPASDDQAPWETPRPVTTAKATQERESAGEEWEAFRGKVFGAFGILKEAKSALWHEENVEKAKAFAAGVNDAWNTVNGKGGA